jgi:SSS family solute:Na+ symporter
MQRLAAIDISIVLLYLIGLLIAGYLLGKKQKTDKDYFLGGRKLKWPMVGISMVMSDIGALEIVGIAGLAYTSGLSMANYDWIGCVPAMIVAAFVFIPYRMCPGHDCSGIRIHPLLLEIRSFYYTRISRQAL